MGQRGTLAHRPQDKNMCVPLCWGRGGLTGRKHQPSPWDWPSQVYGHLKSGQIQGIKEYDKSVSHVHYHHERRRGDRSAGRARRGQERAGTLTTIDAQLPTVAIEHGVCNPCQSIIDTVDINALQQTHRCRYQTGKGWDEGKCSSREQLEDAWHLA